jgi:putative GTP pyrophosphokinase
MLKETLLLSFVESEKNLIAACQKLQASLERALEGVQLGFVHSRVKSRASLARKLGHPEKSYAHLTEVTDIIGLRVATFYEDTVTTVAERVEKNFQVDWVNSIDKSQAHEATHFGYRSLHYVCAVPKELIDLHQLPGGLSFEIQIRSALQHAWAEAEHDIGYKADDVPSAFRRRFSRVASLLELADSELVQIKNELQSYQRRALKHSDSVPLDVVSVEALVDDELVRDVDVGIAKRLELPLDDVAFDLSYLAKFLVQCGLNTTALVRDQLACSREELVSSVPAYLAFAEKEWGVTLKTVPKGYALFFVAHLAIVRSDQTRLQRLTKLKQVYWKVDALKSEQEAQGLAHRVLDAFLPE